MPNYTEHYNLPLPLEEEVYDIQVVNEVTQKVDAALSKKADLGEDGKLLPAQMPEMKGDYIPNSEKGAPDGVATLDSTGKVPGEQIPPLPYDPEGAAEAVKDELMPLIQDAGGFVLMEEDVPPEQRKENRLYAKQVEDPFTFPENAVDMVNQDYLGRTHIYPSRAEMVRMPDGTMLADQQFETQEDADVTKQALEQMIKELEGKIPKIKVVWGTAFCNRGSGGASFGSIFTTTPGVIVTAYQSNSISDNKPWVWITDIRKDGVSFAGSPGSNTNQGYEGSVSWVAIGE